MANTSSAKKAIRSSARKNVINLRVKRSYKEAKKDLEKSITEKGDSKKLLAVVYKKIDKAAKLNVIHKNTASRYKSRLAKLVK